MTKGSGQVPTKRQFDMVILTLILFQPVKGLVKMWAARRTMDNNDNGIMGTTVSGSVRIAT